MLDIICPHCGKAHTYSFGKGDYFEDLGECVDTSNETLFHSYEKMCHFCGYHLFIFSCIENGRFINVLLNPSDEETRNMQNNKFKHFDNYPDSTYDYDARAGLLLGEVTDVVPSQYSTKLILKQGDNINAFGKWWTVKESYKVFDKGKLYERIYRISLLDDVSRLLILRDNSIPVLKNVKWDVDGKMPSNSKMIHSISKNMEVVMDVG